MVGSGDWPGVAGRGVLGMTGSLDPKTMICWAILELSLLFSDSHG